MNRILIRLSKIKRFLTLFTQVGTRTPLPTVTTLIKLTNSKFSLKVRVISTNRPREVIIPATRKKRNNLTSQRRSNLPKRITSRIIREITQRRTMMKIHCLNYSLEAFIHLSSNLTSSNCSALLSR